jgi:hypothetical protein
MLGDDQVIPEAVEGILRPADQMQAQAADLLDLLGHSAQGRQALPRSAQAVAGGRAARFGGRERHQSFLG